MREIAFTNATESFVANPSPEKALILVNNCRNFVSRQAACWTNRNLSYFEKIREVMTEMFLILIEDFKPELCQTGYSILSYLDLRLRRLTRPKKSKTIAFGLVDDFADLGRCSFSPLRLQFTDEIVAAVRTSVVSQEELQAGMLEFLFIHIYPEVAWASRLIAQATGENPIARHEADRKRHQKFNRLLKQAFSKLEFGDWREISEWTSGERSHLAWRIVDLTAVETGAAYEKELREFYQCREDFDKRREEPVNFHSSAVLFRALQANWRLPGNPFQDVAEPAASYGEEMDLIGSLIRRVNFVNSVEEAAQDFEPMKDDNSVVDSVDFDKAAAEVAEWICKLLKTRSS